MKKRCKVVALPTKEKTLMAYDSETREYFLPVCNFNLANSCKYIHLYVVSDDEIKEGNYVIKSDRLGIYVFDPVNNTHDIECKDGCIFPFKTKDYFKKIVATTDASLNRPLIPEQFIKDYCDANGIKEVMVDFIKPKCECVTGCCICRDDMQVEISPIKESWSREEVIRLCRMAFNEGILIADRANFTEEYIVFSEKENEFINNNL